MSQAAFEPPSLDLDVDEDGVAGLSDTIAAIVQDVLTLLSDEEHFEDILRDTGETTYLERADTVEREAPERFTEDQIIEPLLSELGFTDLSQRPGDFADERGAEADYATRVDSERFLIEAEPLNKNLDWSGVGIDQVKSWLENRRFEANYGLATNGLRWVLIKFNQTTYEFETLANVSLREAFIREFERQTGRANSLAPFIESADSESESSEPVHRLYQFLAVHNLRQIITEADDIIKLKQKAITEAFYSEYIRLVFGVTDEETGETTARSLVRGGVSAPESVLQQFENPIRVFSTSLMNRLIFIKFLEDRGIVDENLLLTMRRDYEDGMRLDDFYSSYLHPLFYHVFNQKRDNREGRAADLFEDTPYLNGGLFRPVLTHGIDLGESDYTLDDLIHLERRFDVDDEILADIIDLLESYQFTTNGGEVARLEAQDQDTLDPSVLGNVFEKSINYLAGETGRQKDLGAFYTPDEITRFVASETIRPVALEKLKERLVNRGWNEVEVDRYEEIETLISDLPPSGGVIAALQETLDTVTVCDPACGSGHFLTSVLDELMSIRKALLRHHLEDTLDSQDVMELKKRTIRENIFGVDIVAPAVEIAKLRVWLSVISTLDPDIVENLDDTEIALPNVAFNIRTGNSLIGFPELQVRRGEEVTLTEASLLDTIVDYKGQVAEARKTTEGIEPMLAEIAARRQEMTETVDETFRRLVSDLEYEDTHTLDVHTEEAVRDAVESLAAVAEGTDVSTVGFYVNNPEDPLTDAPDDYTDGTLDALGFVDYTWKAKRPITDRLNDADLDALVDAIVSHPDDGVARLYFERTVSESDLTELSRFHWVVEFPEAVQVEEQSNGGIRDASFGFDVIIGNPPFGADVSGLEKDLINREEFFTCHGANNSAEHFLERAIQLTRDDGRFGLVLPKTLSYYTTWSESRTKVLAESPPVTLFDNGLAFQDVNYEQASIVCSPNSDPDPSHEVDIYVAEDLRDEDANSPTHRGSIPLEEMLQREIFILRELTETDRTIATALDTKTTLFREFWSREPWRGVYIPDSTKNGLAGGETPFIEKVPSVQEYHLNGEDIWHIDLEDLPDRRQDKAERTMLPRLLFKVVRGSKLIVYLDPSGRFASTEKLVNVPTETNETTHTLHSLMAVLDSPVVSYHQQKFVFSETTETARVMDPHYIKDIPIPKITDGEVTTLTPLVQYTLFAAQYHDDGYGGERAGGAAAYLQQVTNCLVASLYFDLDANGLWTDVAEIVEPLPVTEWMDGRFSTDVYPMTQAEEMWATVEESVVALEGESVSEAVNQIYSDSRLQRVREISE